MSVLVKATTTALSRVKSDAATAEKPRHRASGCIPDICETGTSGKRKKTKIEQKGKKKQLESKEVENKIDKLIS